MSTDDDDRTLTELEFVEAAVRRAVERSPRTIEIALLMLAQELMIADISQLNGGGDTRLRELRRLRRRQ
jgi:hypothetical protein